MADTSENAASLRVTRIEALSGGERMQVLTYLLAKYPDAFSELLDEALTAVTGRSGGEADGDS